MAVAIGALAVLVPALGPALVYLVPVNVLRAVVGPGVRWPGSDLAILVLVGAYAVLTWVIVRLVRPTARPVSREQPVPERPGPPPLTVRWIRAFGAFWRDFLAGDTPELLIGVLVTVGVVAVLVKACSLNTAAVVGSPVMVAALLGGSVYEPRRPRA